MESEESMGGNGQMMDTPVPTPSTLDSEARKKKILDAFLAEHPKQCEFDSADAESFTYPHRLVHLDLKGAPPRMSYYEQIFPIIASLGCTGLLVEYEDRFPYHGILSHLQAPRAYTPEDVSHLHSLAAANGLIIIPLVQTFGHFEFILKHDEHRAIREIEHYPNALCPTHPDSFPLVTKMISQVVELHPKDKFLHIGADEVWHIGRCPRCQEHIVDKKISIGEFFLTWIFKVACWVKQQHPHLSLIMWDDMMRNMAAELIKSSGIGELIEPMVWQYQAEHFDLPADVFTRYSSVFGGIWVASAFKGATGSTQFLPPIQHHINNHLNWKKVLLENKERIKNLRGIALTGWQRYDHYSVLCELLPVSLPSLCMCLTVASQGAFTEDHYQSISRNLGFPARINLLPFPRPQAVEPDASFPGHKIYVGVQMWSNFICKYHSINNSEGMMGWFNEYLRSRNFTNPVQVEYILNQAIEVAELLSEVRTRMIPWLLEVYYEDTVEEWVGSFIDPIIQKLTSVIQECKKQILIGGRVRDYPLKNQ